MDTACLPQLPATSDSHAVYTIYGNLVSHLTAIDKRIVFTIFTWNEDLLIQVNQHLMAVYQQAFNLTFFKGLDELGSYIVSITSFPNTCYLVFQ